MPHLKSKAFALAGLVSTVILLLGVRALLDPLDASASFGLPMHTNPETAFVRIYGAEALRAPAHPLTAPHFHD